MYPPFLLFKMSGIGGPVPASKMLLRNATASLVVPDEQSFRGRQPPEPPERPSTLEAALKAVVHPKPQNVGLKSVTNPGQEIVLV